MNLAPFQPSNPATAWQPALNTLNALTFPRDVAAGPYTGGRTDSTSRPTIRNVAMASDHRQPSTAGQGRQLPVTELLKMRMPTWAAKSSPTALTPAEAAAVAAMKADP